MEKVKVLVVDDEKEICEVTRNFLARRNYTVFIATNTSEALKIALEQKPEIVLLDMRLGDESGIELIPKIKEMDKDTKIIMVTALDDAESIQRSSSLGADEYITKPFTAAYLHDLLT